MNDGPARASVDFSLLVLRLASGVIFFAHGAQKVLGVWGGPGLSATVERMDLGPIGYLVALGEFLGGIGLIFGFLTRFSAASLIVIMCGAIAMVHGKNGLLLENGGFEYNLALIALLRPELVRTALIALAFLAGGLFSGRITGVLMDGGLSAYTAAALVLESTLTVLSVAFLRQRSGSG